MISYKPLWHTLLDRGIGKMQLMEMTGFSRATLARMGRDEHIALSVIEKICLTLGCRIEDVVEIKKSPGE